MAAIEGLNADELDKLNIFLINGEPFIFNPQDAVTVREQHRIVGFMVGPLPRAPSQNAYLGLPLQLMPEELSLLLNKRAVRLVKEVEATEDQMKARAHILQQKQQASFQAQQALFREEREREIVQRTGDILEGKRAKYGEEAVGLAERVSDCGGLIPMQVRVTPTAQKHMLLQLFTENIWERELESAERDWVFPSTLKEKTRCAVFRELWERNYFLTSGHKFGGDFLAYPGDPARYHSFYIVICLEQHQALPALDIVSMGRLGANVRKTVLLASLGDEGTVNITSLQWTGMS